MVSIEEYNGWGKGEGKSQKDGETGKYRLEKKGEQKGY